METLPLELQEKILNYLPLSQVQANDWAVKRLFPDCRYFTPDQVSVEPLPPRVYPTDLIWYTGLPPDLTYVTRLTTTNSDYRLCPRLSHLRLDTPQGRSSAFPQP